MADNKLGDAYLELQLRDAKFQQQLRHAAQRAKAAAATLGDRLKVADGTRELARITASTRAITNQMRRATAQTTAFTRALSQQSRRAGLQLNAQAFRQRMNQTFARYMQQIRMMRSVSSVRLTLRDQEFRQRLRFLRQQQRFQGGGLFGGGGIGIGGVAVGTFAGNLAARGIRRAVDEMREFVRLGIEYNANLEMSRNTFAQLTGSMLMGRKLAKDLREFSERTPFQTGDVNRAAVALLATRKVAQKDVLPIIQKIGDAAAGSSEGFEAMPRIIRAITQMLTKGKIQAEEMLQLAEAGVPAWHVLAQAMGKSTAEVQKLGQQGKLGVQEVMLLIDGLGNQYKGLADKQSQTFSGLLSTMQDKVAAMSGSIFKPLFEAMKEWMKRAMAFMEGPGQVMARGIRSMISRLIDDFQFVLGNWREIWGVAVDSATVALMEVMERTADWAKRFLDIGNAVVGAWRDLFAELAKVISTLLARITAEFGKKIQLIIRAAEALKNRDFVAAAAAGVALTNTRGIEDAVGDAVNKSRNSATNAVIKGAAGVAGALGRPFQPSDALKDMKNRLLERVGALVGRRGGMDDARKVDAMRNSIVSAFRGAMGFARGLTPRGVGEFIKGAPGRAMKTIFGAEEEKDERKPGKFEFVNIESFNKRIQEAMSDKKKEAREEKKVGLLGKVAGGVQGVKDAVENAVDVLKALPMGFAE